MKKLTLNNGVSLQLDDDGLWLILTTKNDSSVCLALSTKGEVIGEIINQWVEENLPHE